MEFSGVLGTAIESLRAANAKFEGLLLREIKSNSYGGSKVLIFESPNRAGDALLVAWDNDFYLIKNDPKGDPKRVEQVSQTLRQFGLGGGRRGDQLVYDRNSRVLKVYRESINNNHDKGDLFTVSVASCDDVELAHEILQLNFERAANEQQQLAQARIHSRYVVETIVRDIENFTQGSQAPETAIS